MEGKQASRAAGRRGVGWALALVLGTGLWGGCGSAPVDSGPRFKAPPSLAAGNAPPATTAPLSGRVYLADHASPNAFSQLPEGYRLMPGDEGRVTVRWNPLNPQTRIATVREGAYLLEGLPIGELLEVTASFPGYLSQRQTTKIVATAGRKLNFDHEPDGPGHYLLPLQTE